MDILPDTLPDILPDDLVPLSGGDGVLDQVSKSTLVAAYGTRRLMDSHGVSPLFEINLTTAGTSQDFAGAADTGLVDNAAISTYCSGDTGRGQTWYDQSGNGFTMAATARPLMYSGSLVTEGSLSIPAWYHDGARPFGRSDTFGLTGNPGMDAFVVMRRAVAASGTDEFLRIGAATPGQAIRYSSDAATTLSTRYYDGSQITTSPDLTAATQVIHHRRAQGGTYDDPRVFRNNTELTPGVAAPTTSTVNLVDDDTLIGNGGDMYIQAVVIYATSAAGANALSESDAEVIRLALIADFL